MKRVLFLILLFISLSANATIYYVANTAGGGDDAHTGTNIAEPWLTWGKAFSSTSAGDTVYFRGGVYPHSVTSGAGYTTINSGTPGNLIYYLNYPNEVPILDCNNVTPRTTNFTYAIVANVNYAYFKGLVVRYLSQSATSYYAVGWRLYGMVGVTFDNCITHNIEGDGFNTWGGRNAYFINCDSYNNCDSLTTGDGNPGNHGYGFHVTNTGDASSTIYYEHCRAWGNGDDGWSMYSVGYIEIDSCWSFLNGRLSGAGSGYKIGFSPGPSACPLRRKITNSIAAYNRFSGFNTNDNTDSDVQSMQLYNNIAYRNYDFTNDLPYPSRGFIIYNTTDSEANELLRVYRNNISYGNTVLTGDLDVKINTNASYTHSNNSWDSSPTITIQASDFVSLDSTGLMATRQANGSLPNNACYNNFLHLDSLSSAINSGIDVGIPYNSTAPDMGPFEFDVTGPPAYPLVATTQVPINITCNTAYGYGSVTYDGGLEVYRYLVWSESPNPLYSDNNISCGMGSGSYGGLITGLKANTLYYVRAFASNDQGSTYGNTLTFTTDKMNYIKNKGKVIRHLGVPQTVK